MARLSDRDAYPRWLLIAAPIASLAAAVFVWVGIDTVGEIGPLDRAKLGGIVGVPLALLVPVLTAWAGNRLGPFAGPVMGAVFGLGAALAVGWPFWVEYAGQCDAVGLPVPIGPIAVMGSVVGVTLFGAVLAAGAALDGGRAGLGTYGRAFLSVAVVYVIGFAIVALTLMGLFFGQCVVRPGITP
jgi:hypothetical protein